MAGSSNAADLHPRTHTGVEDVLVRGVDFGSGDGRRMLTSRHLQLQGSANEIDVRRRVQLRIRGASGTNRIGADGQTGGRECRHGGKVKDLGKGETASIRHHPCTP